MILLILLWAVVAIFREDECLLSPHKFCLRETRA